MAAVEVPPAYSRLLVLLGHLFYAGPCPPAWWVDAADPTKRDADSAALAAAEAEAVAALAPEKTAAQLAREAKRAAQADSTGLGVVLLTALSQRQWVEEDELARSLSLQPKLVRRAMRFFEQARPPPFVCLFVLFCCCCCCDDDDDDNHSLLAHKQQEQLVQREHKREGKRARRKERVMLVQAGLREANSGRPQAGACLFVCLLACLLACLVVIIQPYRSKYIC
jgi:hypothetical protein